MTYTLTSIVGREVFVVLTWRSHTMPSVVAVCDSEEEAERVISAMTDEDDRNNSWMTNHFVQGQR